MAKVTVEALIMGGKASAAPPLGPALGPKGVNIGLVVAEINKKTADFAGMQVPVKVHIDMDTKAFEVELGTPPAAALIKQEAGVKKGSGVPQSNFVGNITMDQVLKISRMKEGVLTGKNTKMRCREIMGTCQSIGITIEGMPAQEALAAVAQGKFDEKLK